MPLPSTNISALTDAGPYDMKDKLQFQRNVLGTWQDFHTDVETYFGPILTATFDWDGTDAWNDSLSVPGKIIVPIEVFGVFTPGGAPTAQDVQITIEDINAGAAGGTTGQYPDTAEGQTVSFGFPSAIMTTSSDLQISAAIAGISPFSGTTRFTILYVAKDPI